jgi:hypothetical protein
MDLTALAGTFKDISTGLLALGVALDILTLALGGLCMYFSWLDLHAGSLAKKVFVAVLLGNTMLGGSGAMGVWLGSKFGLT